MRLVLSILAAKLCIFQYSCTNLCLIICRTCTTGLPEDGCVVLFDSLGYKEEVCYCANKDNCNGSTQLTGSVLLVIALAFVNKIFA